MQRFNKEVTNYWVKDVVHNREVESEGKYKCITTVIIEVNGKEYVGESKCSIKDQWVRKIGYKIALGRALKEAYIDQTGIHYDNCIVYE